MHLLPGTVYGTLTTAYGIGLLLDPGRLARPMGRRRTPDVDRVALIIGVRDLLSGASLLAARGDRGRDVAFALRVAADAADAVLLAPTAGPGRQNLVRAVASGWGLTGALIRIRERRR